MNQIFIGVLFILVFKANIIYGQKYFELYYTNTASEQVKEYQLSYNRSEECLYRGRNKYANRECGELSAGGKLSDEIIDSLHQAYRKILPDGLPAGYVPFKYYHITDKKTGHYVIKTVYKIEGVELLILYRVKITFLDIMHNGVFDVESVQLYKADNARKFDPNMVLSLYKTRLEEDSKDLPPPEIK